MTRTESHAGGPERWTVESRALDKLAAAVRDAAAAIAAPPPGPCPSEHRLALALGDKVVPCELRAGHAGLHEWHSPDRLDVMQGHGYSRWSDAGATSRDVADSG